MKYRHGDPSGYGQVHWAPSCAQGRACTTCVKWVSPAVFVALTACVAPPPPDACQCCGAPAQPRLGTPGGPGRPPKYRVCDSPRCLREMYVGRGGAPRLPAGVDHLTFELRDALAAALRDTPQDPAAALAIALVRFPADRQVAPAVRAGQTTYAAPPTPVPTVPPPRRAPPGPGVGLFDDLTTTEDRK